MKVLVVLPTYEEAENIERMLRASGAALPELGVLVVDDGSPDGTAGHRREGRRRISAGSTSCAEAPSPGSAAPTGPGFAWGLERGWDAFVEMDSDFSHDPGALPRPGRAPGRAASTCRSARATSQVGRSRTGPWAGGSSRVEATSTRTCCSGSA